MLSKTREIERPSGSLPASIVAACAVVKLLSLKGQVCTFCYTVQLQFIGVQENQQIQYKRLYAANYFSIKQKMI